VRTAQLFVATLGASSYTFAEATWTQSLPDWIASHVRAFAFLGGVTAQIVSDNLKAGVTKACFYDPVINRTYGDLAAHYDTAVVPARPHKPKDKARPRQPSTEAAHRPRKRPSRASKPTGAPLEEGFDEYHGSIDYADGLASRGGPRYF
jgi:hypothetical protein